MRRRDMLAGTTGALCGLAGCTGSAFERPRPAAGGERGSAAAGSQTDDTDAESRKTIVVGDLDAVPFPSAHPPHEFVLRTESGTERTVTIAIETDVDDLLEREFTVPASRSLEFVLAEPRSYTVTVTTIGSDGGESKAAVGIDREPFDCTRSSTTVTLRESGTVTRSTSSSIPRPELRVADASLEVLAQRCADDRDGDAAVEFADEAVVVDGRITTPTPCYEPSVGEAAYDERRDALAITVDGGEQTAAGCVDCLGGVDYEARIDLEGRYPGRVVVRHGSRGEVRRVATAERPPDESDST